MHSEKKEDQQVYRSNPSNWLLGTSLSLNNWANGHVDIYEFSRAGIRLIELAWRNDTFDLFDPAKASACTKWIHEIRELGMEIWTLHLPYGTRFDVSSDEEGAREEAISLHSQLMKKAQRWNIRKVVLHPSWEPISDEARPLRLEACKRSLAALAVEAERLGIQIAVECLPRTCLGNSSSEMSTLIAADPRLGICCDVNHLLREAPEDFIHKLGNRIITVHISDCDGKDERHWMPGKGIIRWSETIRALVEQGYEGPFMFEIRQPVPSELVDCWDQLLEDYLRTRGKEEGME